MKSLAELENELASHRDDINTCKEALQLDPNDTDAQEMIPMLEGEIADIESQIAAKKREAPPPPPADDVPPPPKYDMSKHPKYRDAAAELPPPPPEEIHAQTVFNVKDLVMAKFSEDKQWYQATIVSKTGSSSDPVYKVTFKGYGNTETKRKYEIRPVIDHSQSKKRKADGSPAITSAPTQTIPPPPTPASPKAAQPVRDMQNGAVISAAPAIDTNIVKKKEPSKVSDGPTRLPPEPKKLKGTKALDKQKSSWQDFQKSGPKKAANAGSAVTKKLGKDSMFRTPDLPGAKVGFTGSGKPMQKDQARSTWKYGADGAEE